MKVLQMKEREDGGAELQVDMTEEERLFFLEFGFNEMLKKTLKMFNKQFSPKKGIKNAKSTNQFK